MNYLQKSTFLAALLLLLPHCCSTNMIDRSSFVKDILGIPENLFNQNENALRSALSFSEHTSSDPFLNRPQKVAFIRTLAFDTKKQEYVATTTQYQAGYFEEMSLGDLREATKDKKPGSGVFNVIESANFPGKYMDMFDIGALQAKPENRDAVFQVASNFNGLEFSSNHGYEMQNITAYIHDNTQGPGASISAAPGTLLRQYYLFYDTHKQPKEWAQAFDRQIQFLGNTDIPTKNGYVYFPQKSVDTVKFNPQTDINSIKIGYQGATQVTYGLTTGSYHQPISDPNQIINQVFTAAVDFAPWSGSGNNIQNEKQVVIAKAILQAAYEGTLRAALFKDKKKVMLTLIGGGVFENDIRWISDLLINLKKFIIESGLDVTLIIYNASSFQKESKPHGMWSGFRKSLEQLVRDTNGTYTRYDNKNISGTIIIQPTYL